MGSENGGIVVNLGTGGVAFQAAMKVIAEPTSTLTLCLRGSGLNFEIPGELAWVGATHKEVGVRFTKVPLEVQRNIADWIARETGAVEPAAPASRPAHRPIPVIPITSGAEKHDRRSLSAALAMSQRMSAEFASSVSQQARRSDGAAPSNAAAQATPSSAQPVIPPSVAGESVRSNEPAGHGQSNGSEASALLTQLREAQAAPSHPPGNSSSREPKPSAHTPAAALPALGARDLAVTGTPGAAAKEKLNERPPTAPATSENSRPQIRKEGPPARPRQPVHSMEQFRRDVAIERWIPPALMNAWNGGNERHRRLLVGAGAACIVGFALMLILSVGRTRSSAANSAGVPPLQQRNGIVESAPDLFSSSGVARTGASPSTSLVQTQPVTPAPVAAAARKVQTRDPSLFDSLANNLLGWNNERPKIDDDQVRVEVWTSQRTGYYYCTDRAYYKSVRPGAFMAQGDALQSGYRPRLGQFCN